ncbi:Rrf2 family transcriptional regulator [Marinicrinis sediminis]|uniref:HTH-type transcriptional regulator NsrR n=1 Tax=Marinicrinis sediminis TaxID=1652465 RepID=A0ABW5RA31_9BACL
MRLTQYTDYALRLLIYLGSVSTGRLASIGEIAQVYNLSSNHLSKIVHQLAQEGFIETIRGRNGGIRLAGLPENINIGQVVRFTEDGLQIVDCFRNGDCVINPVCTLKSVLYEAGQAFYQVLDQYTLQDLVSNQGALRSYLQLE